MSNIFDLFKSIEKPAAGPITHLLVGLGNPGADYAGTRHNVGFMTLDYIASREGIRVDRARFKGLCGEGTVGGVRCLLLKPETYMNLSGEAVAEAANFYKIPPENVLVLCDDVNFDVGMARVRRKGTHGGHNGLRNIQLLLGSEDYPRIKIGVGKKPRPDYDLADWVLGRFPDADRAALDALMPDLHEAVKLILAGKIDEAMNRYSK